MTYQFEDFRKEKRLLISSTTKKFVRVACKYYSKKKGYKTKGASTAEQVLKWVREFSPQVILMGKDITERNNIKPLIIEIKKLDRDCNIMFFARENESEIIQEAWKAGAFYFLRFDSPLVQITSEVSRAFEDYFGRMQIRYLRNFVFVLMPFSEAFSDIYELGIKQAIDDCGLFCLRVDEQHFTESILERIIINIKRARFIVADMTGCNPNVFYEVGYAHATEKPIIFLTQDDPSKIPFDLKHKPHIHYKKKEIRILKQLLDERLKGLLDRNVGLD